MFPAYKFEDSTSVNPSTSKEFLQNPSYDSIPVSSSTLAEIISSSDFSSEGEIEDDSRGLEVLKKPPTPVKLEMFYIDTERKKDYLKLDFLPIRAIPFYKIPRYLKHFSEPRKPFRRYFKAKRVKKLTQDTGRKLDEKQSKDEEMRIYLIKNSHEVDKWIEYIDYKVRV